MWRTIILYGVALALLVFVLKFIEYRYLMRDLSLEFYLGVVALFFTVIGVWTGIRLTGGKTNPPAATPFIPDEENIRRVGISRREHEVLALMAQGFSNQEIADRLYVSLNTVKTHSANLFLKLEAKRRTQAIQKGKQLRLIP